MLYLSRMLGKPVLDAAGEEIGHIHDIAIATGEIFPRVTSLAFVGPDKTPFMLSWRKYVDSFDGERITLNASRPEIRFSYQQPDEVLLSRDLLDKQIVDTQGMKVVRVNDLKLSESKGQLRLLGAEVGIRGILRHISPALERTVQAVARLFRTELAENIIAWNYMDLLERDLSQVKLSITHKRLHELHPADVADILEQLTPSQRAKVFTHLDNEQAAHTISELEDELQAGVIDDLTDQRASDILEEMDPDDAADIIGDLPYEKAETLLRLMGVKESRAVRRLLGYKENSAGGIMTPEVTTVTEEMTVQQVIEHLRSEAAENESIYYIYVVDEQSRLDGVVSLRDLIISAPDTPVSGIAERDVFTVGPDDDQEDVADMMSKYDLLALPVVDEGGKLLGMVTVDDALDVMEEEADEDLAIATGAGRGGPVAGIWFWLARRSMWVLVWAVASVVLLAVVESTPAGRTQASLFLTWGLLFLPLVLRTAEDMSSRAVTELIEEPEEGAPGVWRHLAVDGAAGLVLGTVGALIVFGIMDLLSAPLDAAVLMGATVGLSLLSVALGGVAVTEIARRLTAADRRVSSTALGLGMMCLGVLVFVGLSFVAGALLEAVGSPWTHVIIGA